jgi:nucleoside-diphosphate-sugar epimerase
MTKVLILGGTGYIGSALFKHLTNQTIVVSDSDRDDLLELNYDTKVYRPLYNVDTVDLEWFGNYVNERNFVADYRTLSPEFLAKYDVVILVAAYSSPAMCTASGLPSVFNNNIANFTNLLPKLREGQKFIYASSITVYQGITGEVDEEAKIIQPATNTYDFSKQDCDRIMALYPQVEFYGLRLATVCGVSDNWRSDIMVNAMTDTAMLSSEVKLFNPRNSKPILYIRDLCRAVEKIITTPKDNRGFYNLASFNGITEEIAEIVADVTNSKLRVLSTTEMTGNSLPTSAYDITVSTKKFEEIFNFKFFGTTERITEEIVKQIDKVHKSKRILGIEYK